MKQQLFRYLVNSLFALSLHRNLERMDAVVATVTVLIESHMLKLYDGIQLAAAVELNDLILAIRIAATGVPTLTPISSDNQLNRAAVAERLTV
jgi:hypothetical protein